MAIPRIVKDVQGSGILEREWVVLLSTNTPSPFPLVSVAGARIVTQVLNTPELSTEWRAELLAAMQVSVATGGPPCQNHGAACLCFLKCRFGAARHVHHQLTSVSPMPLDLGVCICMTSSFFFYLSLSAAREEHAGPAPGCTG